MKVTFVGLRIWSAPREMVDASINLCLVDFAKGLARPVARGFATDIWVIIGEDVDAGFPYAEKAGLGPRLLGEPPVMLTHHQSFP